MIDLRKLEDPAWLKLSDAKPAPEPEADRWGDFRDVREWAEWVKPSRELREPAKQQ